MATMDAADLHGIIGGALFDFLGRLTTLPKELTLGSAHEPSRAMVIMQGWAQEHGLDLDASMVQDWDKKLPAPAARILVKDNNGEVVAEAPAQPKPVILSATLGPS